MYIREPVSEIKNDIKNIFHPGKKSLDITEVRKKIKDNFNIYDDGAIMNQIALLKQYNVKDDDIVDIVQNAIFDGSSLTVGQVNHAKGIFSQIACSKRKKKDINQFIENELKQTSGQSSIPFSGKQPQVPTKPLNPIKDNSVPVIPNQQNKVFEYHVGLFREASGKLVNVASGYCRIEDTKIVISANVTKSFDIKDIAEIYKKTGNLFIYLKTRKQPFILSSNDIDDLFNVIEKLFLSSK